MLIIKLQSLGAECLYQNHIPYKQMPITNHIRYEYNAHNKAQSLGTECLYQNHIR
jgi:hypothetical protein